MTDPEPDPTGDSMEDREALASDLNHLNELKLRKSEIEKEIEDWQATLVKDLNADQLTEVEFYDTAGRPLKATVVTGTTRTLDLEALVEMDSSLADAVSKRVVDNERWKKAEKMGLLSQPKYQQLIHTKPKRPYILFTAPLEETTDEQ